MQGDILFDDIYIGHSLDEAKDLADKTFKLKRANEPAINTDPITGV